MAAKAPKECNTILAEFFAENTIKKLNEKHQTIFNPSQFLKDIFDVVCQCFPANFDHENEVNIVTGVGKFSLLDFSPRICEMFSSTIILQASAEYLKDLDSSKKYHQCLIICKVLAEIFKNCSCEWIIGIDSIKAQDLKLLETSDLEEQNRNITQFHIFLLKFINLMSLDLTKLNDCPKLKLYPGILQLCFLVLKKLSENSTVEVFRNLWLSIQKKVLCEIVMICIQQVGDQCWALDDCKKMAMAVLESLIVMCGCRDVLGLLCGNGGKTLKERDCCFFPNGVLRSVLEKMKTFMSKNKLPDYPVAVHIIVWSIRNMKHPYLGEHISMILPPLLMLVDDYRVENRVTGIETLSHVIENMNATELCWYGRANMIYDALHHRIRTNQPEVMRVLQLCLLKIIKVIEPSPKRPIASPKMNKCDENFQIILTSMEFESKIVMRRAYCSNLALFIDHMGITIVRHLTRLLRVVFGYLEIGDGDTEDWRLLMLDILKSILLNAWPKVPNYMDDILRCLMKVVIDVSMSSVALTLKHSMFEKIENCLVLLLCLCGESVRNQLECMTSGIGLNEAEELITRALDRYNSNPHIEM
ncbi:TELO2-interacting protein 2-like [Dendronephthya gigantea]|uniref:TELO2-interacting protein 2-like n=1 Tax=Dendronephthya gigantea TaxID=151771 RepID=UPI0010698B5B|nr:TELO2-interacting protein 2-like [Dendronephthya gigantea]